MEIINNYQETINYYNRKLGHAQDEWQSGVREMEMLISLLEENWQGRAGEEAVLKLEEFRREAAAPINDMEAMRAYLAALGLAIEEELRRLAEEEAKREMMECMPEEGLHK